MTLFRPPPTQQIFKKKENLISARQEVEVVNFQQTMVAQFMQPHGGKVVIKNKVDALIEFERINYVTHYVHSRR